MAQDLYGQFRVGRGITDHVMVDVDGTLLIWPTRAGGAQAHELAAARSKAKGTSFIAEHLPAINTALVAELKKWQRARRGTVVIWTMGGPEHAEMARILCGFEGKVLCIGKPDLIVDDAKHDKLFARIRAILPHEFKCPDS